MPRIKTTVGRDQTPQEREAFGTALPIFGPTVNEVEMKRRKDVEDAYNQTVTDLAVKRAAAEQAVIDALSAVSKAKGQFGDPRLNGAGLPQTISGTNVFGLDAPEDIAKKRMKEAAEDAHEMAMAIAGAGKAYKDATGHVIAHAKVLTEGHKLALNLAGTLVAGLSAAVAQAILFGKSVNDVFKSLLNTILQTVIQAGVKGFLSLLPGIGPLVSKLQTGGTFGMMQQPIYAQSGVVMSGIRGVDTEPAMLGRGETVLSHNLTDRLDRFLTVGGSQPINLHVEIHSALGSRQELRDVMANELAPAMLSVLRTGGFRRAA